jgi:phosphoglycolate phosphatase
MHYDAVMFDLDGTLADTLADIAAAANHALTTLGLPPRPVADFRYLAGQGLEWLMTEALGPARQTLVPQGMTLFKAFYAEHGMDQTVPYPGITDLLDALTARKLKLAVLSNKPDVATQAVVKTLLPRWTWHAVQGQLADVPRKPDPAGALAIAARLAIDPARWLYIGDTAVDMQTATAAGMFAVGVTWGFRTEQELREHGANAIIHHPRQVLDLLTAAPDRPVTAPR